MRQRAIRILKPPATAGLLMIVVALPVAAQPLTFTQALDLASSNSPSVDAREATTAGARRSAVAADQLPDPKLDLNFNDFRITQAERDPPFPNTYIRQTIGVRQDIPNLKKRHARAERASADVVAAEAGEVVATRNVRVGAALAWIDLYYAERRLDILKGLASQIELLTQTIGSRLTSGSATAAGAFDPQILKAELSDRRSERLAAIGRAKAQLTRWTGAANPESFGMAPTPDIDAGRLRAGVAELPGLKAADASIGQSEADVALARAQKNPDISVNASFARRQPQFGTFVSVGVSIDLPLFAKKRQDPRIDASLRAAQAARLDRIDAERAALGALGSDLADHQMYQEKFEHARDLLVPLAKQRALAAQGSYAAGRIGLGSALGETVALANAEIDLLDREAALERDAVRIMLVNTGDVR
jgi:cobalt-zinc-cadmium efflux system outer membrane protein